MLTETPNYTNVDLTKVYEIHATYKFYLLYVIVHNNILFKNMCV